MKYRRILAIAPHTDDIELGCGATISKLIDEHIEVYYVALSDCQDTFNHTKLKQTTLAEESKKALQILGLKKKNIFIYHFTNKHFSLEHRDIFENLEALKNKIHPNLILIPDKNETHQDHKTVAEQAISVFRRDTSILSYEQPWNNYDFAPNFYVSISKQQLDKKLKALSQFKSQRYFKRPYMSTDFIKGLAIARGIQINAPFAESFKVIKIIDA